MKKIASVVLAKCQQNKKIFGIRCEKTTNSWNLTWAFPIDEKKSVSEGYGETLIKGELSFSCQYPGCPYCKASSFFQCGKCHKIGCFEFNTSKGKCPHCGMEFISVTETNDFNNIKGRGI
jgi:Zn finger protein HypA/HybF involved in hydrogenase expression